jgi:hypothetical protein
MNFESLARSTRFQKRSQRKINIRDIVLGVIAVAATGRLSFERVAASIARRAKSLYSKQAFHKRLDASVIDFLAAIFVGCFKPTLQEATTSGLFIHFKRVLLHDSTTISLPDRYSSAFPGSRNQNKSFSQLKIQIVSDLLQSSVEHVSISGFTRNDQSASPDILHQLQAGDLIIRDLGYFVCSVFQKITHLNAFFLSRYRQGVTTRDPITKRPIHLAKALKKQNFFDANVLLGEDSVPVRLVALPVPLAVTNMRRRELRQNRDIRLNPSEEHFYLLGWNIFVTNVSADIWAPEQLQIIYRLRWRIETLFKAWKSHLGLAQLSNQCLGMVRLSVMTKLIFCAFVSRTCHHIETTSIHAGRHASIMRIAKILSGVGFYFEAALVNIDPQALLAQLLHQHAFYDKRTDRHNFAELLLDVSND